MKKLIIGVLCLGCIAFFFFFYQKGQNGSFQFQRKVTIDDDFYVLEGSRTSHWDYITQEKDMNALERYRSLYEKNRSLQNNQYHASFKIPKLVHIIWLGPKNFPVKSIKHMRSWIAHHPDWTFYYWTDRDRPPPCKGMVRKMVQDFKFTQLEECYYLSDNWGEKSDILRYELLYKYGGVYSDHDANCLKPFHNLHAAYDFYGCLEMPHAEINGYVITPGNGVMGAKPKHPILWGCIQAVKNQWRKADKLFPNTDALSQAKKVMYRTYIALTYSLEKNLALLGNTDIIFPASYFFAQDNLPSFYSKHFYAAAWNTLNDKPSAASQKKFLQEQFLQEKLSKLKRKISLIKNMEVASILLAVLSLGGLFATRKHCKKSKEHENIS